MRPGQIALIIILACVFIPLVVWYFAVYRVINNTPPEEQEKFHQELMRKDEEMRRKWAEEDATAKAKDQK